MLWAITYTAGTRCWLSNSAWAQSPLLSIISYAALLYGTDHQFVGTSSMLNLSHTLCSWVFTRGSSHYIICECIGCGYDILRLYSPTRRAVVTDACSGPYNTASACSPSCNVVLCTEAIQLWQFHLWILNIILQRKTEHVRAVVKTRLNL